MKNVLKNLSISACFKPFIASAFTLLAFNANATMMLSLDDNAGNTLTLTDNVVGEDTSPDLGWLTFNGSLGVWVINGINAFGDPFYGDQYADRLHLSSFNATSFAGGQLTIKLTQTDMDRNPGHISGNFGGSSGGDMDFELYIDANNDPFGMGTKVYDSGSLGAGGVSDNFSAGLLLTDPYALTMVITITHANALTPITLSSFDYDVKIPTPGTLALFGLGLLGLAVKLRRNA